MGFHSLCTNLPKIRMVSYLEIVRSTVADLSRPRYRSMNPTVSSADGAWSA
jgi:hypothetical protein